MEEAVDAEPVLEEAVDAETLEEAEPKDGLIQALLKIKGEIKNEELIKVKQEEAKERVVMNQVAKVVRKKMTAIKAPPPIPTTTTPTTTTTRDAKKVKPEVKEEKRKSLRWRW